MATAANHSYADLRSRGTFFFCLSFRSSRRRDHTAAFLCSVNNEKNGEQAGNFLLRRRLLQLYCRCWIILSTFFRAFLSQLPDLWKFKINEQKKTFDFRHCNMNSMEKGRRNIGEEIIIRQVSVLQSLKSWDPYTCNTPSCSDCSDRPC